MKVAASHIAATTVIPSAAPAIILNVTIGEGRARKAGCYRRFSPASPSSSAS
jgi:hypothetical protein